MPNKHLMIFELFICVCEAGAKARKAKQTQIKAILFFTRAYASALKIAPKIINHRKEKF